MKRKLIGNKTVDQWKKEFPVLRMAAELEQVFWLNPRYKKDAALSGWGVSPADMDDAADRLTRFAPFIAKAFPETAKDGGIIESPLREIPKMLDFIKKESKVKIGGKLFLKCDSQLPISGSIKARGGIYEVLAHAEKLALEKGMLKETDSYDILLEDRFRDYFSSRELAVGSTGNLGLSIGIMGARLGFKTTVHMSADARQWKKDLLRSKGVTVVEYQADYSKAVEEGRKLAGPNCHFVDDENSKTLFLGYSVAALRLKKQFEEQGIPVDPDHPLFVYLPCGVGGGPGGVAYGIKRVFGAAAHCFFAEPTHAPCMLLGLVTGLQDKVSVGDFGIDNKTCADGLAVGRPSSFVGTVMDTLLRGECTVSDEQMYYLVYRLAELEDLWLEPSATAGFMGPTDLYGSKNGQAWLREQFGKSTGPGQATHLVWATGGGMVPPEEMQKYYRKGKGLAE